MTADSPQSVTPPRRARKRVNRPSRTGPRSSSGMRWFVGTTVPGRMRRFGGGHGQGARTLQHPRPLRLLVRGEPHMRRAHGAPAPRSPCLGTCTEPVRCAPACPSSSWAFRGVRRRPAGQGGHGLERSAPTVAVLRASLAPGGAGSHGYARPAPACRAGAGGIPIPPSKGRLEPGLGRPTHARRRDSGREGTGVCSISSSAGRPW